MISVFLSLGLCQAINPDLSQFQFFANIPNVKPFNLLQLSDDDSGVNDSGFDSDTRMLVIFLLNVVACILCCGFIQAVIYVSKLLNMQLLKLQSNYMRYKSLLKFKEFKATYDFSQTESEQIDSYFNNI